ncbi:hypothetical protein H4W29_005240 [Rhizobium viscosum]|uniref:Uncharacterized protein n=1 Tax=Rhizobium viscosum TaxID=1673 RepID=A0ABR9IXR8_RHIVS|nr:hypothetical protein [Rhizobium viscosum]
MGRLSAMLATTAAAAPMHEFVHSLDYVSASE